MVILRFVPYLPFHYMLFVSDYMSFESTLLSLGSINDGRSGYKLG